MKDTPNILFLFPDQHRGDWLPYPADTRKRLDMRELPIRMPHVEALMQEGVTFVNAMTPSPLCAPARACLAAGTNYRGCGVVNNDADYPLLQPTFYQVLSANGYSVGGVGKFDLHKRTKWWGLDGWTDDLAKLGFTHGIDNAGKIDAIQSGRTEPKDPYMNYLYEKGWAELHLADMTERGKRTEPTPLPEEAYCDNWLSRNGIDMLHQFPKGKPWFLQVNFTGPHNPWDVTRAMKSKWEGVEFPQPEANSGDPRMNNEIRQNYAAMLENIDRNIGQLIEAVANRGELDRTYIVYASDHGEMLGDRDRYGKGLPDRGSVTIPLVITGPGCRRNTVSDALVQLQDLSSTFLDIAGLSMPTATDSHSLRKVMEGSLEEHRPYLVSELSKLKNGVNDWTTIRDGRYKLVLEEGEKERLYDLSSDAWESSNIAKEHPDLVNRLQSYLAVGT